VETDCKSDCWDLEALACEDADGIWFPYIKMSLNKTK